MIWSLISHVEQPPSNNLFQKFESYFMRGDTMPLLHQKIIGEYMLPQYLQESED